MTLPVLGLMPAAGKASRLGALPCSKEILPIRLRPGGNPGSIADGPPRIEVACEGLLDAFRCAGIEHCRVVLDPSKGDVARHLGDGGHLGLRLAYDFVEGSRSVPETLAAAGPFLEGSLVAMGFPDVRFRPRNAFQRLLERQRATGADLVLGQFPTQRPWLTDMVATDSAGRVTQIQVRPQSSSLDLNWLLALWGPAFTRVLLRETAAGAQDFATGELQLGTVMARALEEGLSVQAVPFPEGWFIDMGTPEDLARAWRGILEDSTPAADPEHP